MTELSELEILERARDIMKAHHRYSVQMEFLLMELRPSKPTANAEGTFDFICLKCGAGCWMGDEQCPKCKSDLGENSE